MSDDEFAGPRPDPQVVVEVPLVGDPRPTASAPPPADHTPRGRRFVALIAAGALAGGVTLAVVLVDADTDPGGAVAEPSPAETSSPITTPPTLVPLNELPTPDDPALRRDPSPRPDVPAAISPPPAPPSYPAVTGVVPSALGDIGFEEAVARFGDDVARRSTTRVELGTAGFVIDVTIVRDPERDRYRVTLDSRGRTEVAIVDVASGTTHINPGTDRGIDVPNAEIIAGSSASTVNEHFDRLLLGPLRPDTIDETTVGELDPVRIAGIGPARRFATDVKGSVIPEWQIYSFSPVFEFRVEDRPSLLEYSAYVDARGDLRQVDGATFIGNVPQLVIHRIDRLEPPEPIELVLDRRPPGSIERVPADPVAADGPDG